MRTTYPILPITAAAPVRVLASMTVAVVDRFKALGRALQNRAQARALADMDGRMLADIGISRSDLRDAFSEPLWEDPTAILRERALERRVNRQVRTILVTATADAPGAFVRPRLDRPASQTI